MTVSLSQFYKIFYEKNYKNFQRNQPLYMQGLNVNYGVGFRDYEDSDTDLGSGFVGF